MRLSTIRLIATLVLVLLMAPLAIEAQPATTVYRIGRLNPGSPLLVAHLWEVVRQGLHELGYVEDQNLIIESRYAEGSEERLRDLMAELVRLPVDVLVAEGTAAIRAAQHATHTIPIVMAAPPRTRLDKGSSPAWRTRGEYYGLELPERGTPRQAA